MRMSTERGKRFETSGAQMLDEFGPLRDKLAEKVPLGRMADATEVARLVLFLASDDAAYCSGHEFVVDGATRS